VRRGVATGSLCAALVLVSAPAASGQDPSRLWSEFPLEQERNLPPAEPVEPVRPAKPARDPPSSRPVSVDPLVAAAVGGVVLALALSIWPTRRRTARLAIGEAECDMVTPTFSPQRSTSVSEQPQETRSQTIPSEHASGDTGGAKSYADIGERVAGVLAAAEQAAQEITSHAEQGAAGIRRQAEEAASSRLEQARQEADKTRSEAERDVRDTREAVDSYASQRRREAEEQSQRMLAEAEAEARAVREAAEEMAVRIEDTARRRQEALREESRLVEARMQRALEGFRQMATRLEDLLETPERADGEESLVEALDVDRRRQPTA
jgi:hypothetical protein